MGRRARISSISMAVRPIVLHPDEVLRQKCKKVGHLDAKLQQLIDDMVETLKDAKGVGLAAPQVGVPLRLTVIRLPEDYDDPKAGQLLVRDALRHGPNILLRAGGFGTGRHETRLNCLERNILALVSRHGGSRHVLGDP